MNRPACWALLGLLCLSPALRADIRGDLEAGRLARLSADLRQLRWGQQVVAEARRHLGEPYVWGGKAGDRGFDCSGYAQAVYLACGVSLPASAQAQLAVGTPVPREGLRPGDLLFFTGQGSPFHVGIYEGGGRFLQAPGTGKRIQSTALSGAWTGRRWIGARRHAAPAPPPVAKQALDHPQREKQP